MKSLIPNLSDFDIIGMLVCALVGALSLLAGAAYALWSLTVWFFSLFSGVLA